jgi:AraC-like DNA-binding protein
MMGSSENIMDRTDLEESKGTISVSLVHEALMVAYSRGLDTRLILQKAEIAPEILHSAKARIPVSAYARLWTALANHMNDEFFGMDSHPMRRGSYQLLSKMLLQAETLEKAVQDMLKFLNFILDDLQVELQLEQDKAYLVLHDQGPVKRMFSYATYLMLVHGLICWLSGQRVILDKIELRCMQPLDDQDYRVRFCEKIYYGASQNRIEFSRHYLEIKIKKDKNAWYDFLKHTPQNLLVRYKNPDSLSFSIRKYLSELIPAEWPELTEIAARFNLSETTMHRRLKYEGVSYQQLKNDIRRDIAIEYLTHTDLSLQDISEQIDFHDASAFHRAFKKWTGVSPGTYRQNRSKL